MILRDGQTITHDPRLDRIKQFDERSRGFALMAAGITPRVPRSYHWSCAPRLDQGREGACVGFSLAHELAARPAPVWDINADTAMQIYREAQRIDPWPGENYDGTSVLAGVKVLHRQGWFRSYRWAFSIEELVLGLGYNGPAVLGIPWLSGMYDAPNGILRATGHVVGGHAILARGVNVKNRTVTLRNSWGPGWGDNGDARISFDDLARLLDDDGEAVFLIGRKTTSEPLQ